MYFGGLGLWLVGCLILTRSQLERVPSCRSVVISWRGSRRLHDWSSHCTRQGFVLRTGVEDGAEGWDIAWHLQGDVRPDKQTSRDHQVGVVDEFWDSRWVSSWLSSLMFISMFSQWWLFCKICGITHFKLHGSSSHCPICKMWAWK